MKITTVLALSLVLTAGAFAQNSTSSELKELKDAIAAQQQQIQQLQQQVQSRDCSHPAVAAAGWSGPVDRESGTINCSVGYGWRKEGRRSKCRGI